MRRKYPDQDSALHQACAMVPGMHWSKNNGSKSFNGCVHKVLDFCAKKYEMHMTSEIITISHSTTGDEVISWIGKCDFIFEMVGNELKIVMLWVQPLGRLGD